MTRFWPLLIGPSAACAFYMPILATAGDIPKNEQSTASARSVVPGERLSDWMLRNANLNGYLPALQWQVPAEKGPQDRLRRSIIRGMQEPGAAGWPAVDRQAFVDWLQSLPLTGRLSIAIPDARWLQASADQDPILLDGHQVVPVARPNTLTVLSTTGNPCAVEHTPGALIRDYLSACLPGGATGIDAVWLVQADGRSTRYGVATWNAEPQAEPAPGAWLWAPQRAAKLPDVLSDGIARFLATQFPGEPTLPLTRATDHPAPVVGVRVNSPVPRAPYVSASDWGEIGLLQTPTARMAPSGEVRLNVTTVAPYTRTNTMFQALDWLEGGFRYTDIGNRLYGPAIAGEQSYKDKSLDIKLRLAQESYAWPEIAFGVRDLGGTGLFSSEYFVANKRFGDFDWSLGLGWGNMAARGNVKNPLAAIDGRFENRPSADFGQGGTVSGGGFLRGPAALFGGVQWQAPGGNWVVKAEYDGNDYQNEPLANNLPVKSPINVGVVYRVNSNLDVTAAIERGERYMLGFTLHGGLQALQAPKLLDPKIPRIAALSPINAPPDWGRTVADLEQLTGWSVQVLDQQAHTTRLVAETDGAIHLQERVDRALRVLHRDAPSTSRTFAITLRRRGLVLSHLEIDRTEWVAQHTAPQPPSLRLPAVAVSATPPITTNTAQNSTWLGKRGGFNAEVSPIFRQILGGPDSFVLYQLGVQAVAQHHFTDSTWASGALNFRVLDNYDSFVFDGRSNLPRVRTDQRQYVTTARVTMPQLQLTHVADLGSGHYASAYGGMLESMYGGVGAEWLYRPWRGPFAVGIDLNRVQKRGFRQDFSFRDYMATTGHATVYWDTGWENLHAKISAGQYLAQDTGVTLDVQRTFPNGVVAGAYATKTNVSAEQFGEGSFDKGIYVTIPFDVMLPRSTSGIGTIAWSPLTRDGGALLGRSYPLYGLTQMRDRSAFSLEAARPTKAKSAEYTSYAVPPLLGTPMRRLGDTTVGLGRQLTALPAATWLYGGGVVIAASLLDQSVDQWAQNEGTGAGWDAAARASNAIPLVLAAGTGMAFTGVAGDEAARTAAVAMQAAGFTLAGNLATRWAVGRARPNENMGSSQFNGMQPGAASSGFASNHVALAFALATPFAQRHDMPWLYALAATSALGRVQQREHWLSDTAAGALLGYTVGTLLIQQASNEGAPRWRVTGQSVEATWSFK